jgi:hypothetical protein
MCHGVNLLLPAVVLALAGCGKSDAPGKSEASENTVQIPSDTGGGTGGIATTIHLVVQDGPQAGTYDAKSSDITCTYGFAGPGSWGNQYSVTGKKPKEFSSLQLIVPDAKDAADGSDEFLMTIGFGEPFKEGYSEHVIDTQKESKKKGSGTIQVDDRKTAGTVTFKGKAEDGASLEGTIDCHQMMRGGD